jgi:hypothetical protein
LLTGDERRRELSASERAIISLSGICVSNHCTAPSCVLSFSTRISWHRGGPDANSLVCGNRAHVLGVFALLAIVCVLLSAAIVEKISALGRRAGRRLDSAVLDR